MVVQHNLTAMNANRQLKDNAKTAKRSVSMANKYYQNMSRVSSEPQFMDQKK